MSLYLISGPMEKIETLPAQVRGLSKKIYFLKDIVQKKKKKNWDIWNFTNEKAPAEGLKKFHGGIPSAKVSKNCIVLYCAHL